MKTVETHRRQVMERLQIFDVPGLVRFALRHGIVHEVALARPPLRHWRIAA